MIEEGFMSIVGSILYASAMTRPDISFHTAFLAKLMVTPSPAALDAALGIVSYLTSPLNMSLCRRYSRSSPSEVDSIAVGLGLGCAIALDVCAIALARGSCAVALGSCTIGFGSCAIVLGSCAIALGSWR